MDYNYNKKSIWKWILLYILIAAVAYGLIYYFFFNKKENSNYNQESSQNQVENNSEITDSPVINSITPNYGPVGTVIEVKGENLAGFESDLYLWFVNANGVKGFLESYNRTSDTYISVKIPAQLCQTDNSYSGLPCESWLQMIPGVYKVYTDPWDKKSNIVNFEITK